MDDDELKAFLATDFSVESRIRHSLKRSLLAAPRRSSMAVPALVFVALTLVFILIFPHRSPRRESNGYILDRFDTPPIRIRPLDLNWRSGINYFSDDPTAWRESNHG